MKTRLFVTSLIALFSVAAHAADTTTSLPATPSAPSAESSSATAGGQGLAKKFEEDHKITDAELKSRAGSQSRFSLKADFKYYGPTLDNLSNADQPNPDGAVAATAVGPKGSLGARYRFDSSTSISGNIGYSDRYLFTNKPTSWDMSNPYLTYDKSFKFLGLQVVGSAGVTWVTSDTFRSKGERWGLTPAIYTSKRIGDSDFSWGTTTTASYYFFDRAYVPNYTVGTGKKAKTYGDDKIARVSVVFAPVLKYNVTQNLNLNTSFGFNFINPRYYDTAFKTQSRLMNEWVGFGYAITRDIYINPYVQIYPTEFSWKTSSVNLSTVISLL